MHFKTTVETHQYLVNMKYKDLLNSETVGAAWFKYGILVDINYLKTREKKSKMIVRVYNHHI